MREKNMIGLHTVIARVEELVSADMDGETALMSVENGAYYGMDAIGSRIWALIEKPRTVSELCDALLQEFDVEREECERDVLAFLNKLAENKLLKVTNDGAAG